tara:strand:+ start:937 stop:1512 length:576 start_codon:yes stop_codon:yes gene_type:complete
MNLVFATHNSNKLSEIQALMPNTIILKSLSDINCNEDIIEDAKTIAGNAMLKAKYVKENYTYDCFADDTGLEIEALNGEPGIYSARYAGEQRNSKDNMNKVLEKLKGKKNRNAKFKTVIALILNEKEYTFEGICKGTIIEEPRGDRGFGYDPIFQPEGYGQTFAEFSMELKGKISHRGKAVEKLLNFLHSI